MSDELRLRKAADRAARAQALVNDDLLKEAFATYERELMDLWGRTRAEAASERENIWLAVKTVRRIQEGLVKVITDGKIASAELNKLLGRAA